MFEYSYKKLPSLMYKEIMLNSVKNPKLLLYNEDLSNKLELDLNYFTSTEGLMVISGNKTLLNEEVIAQAYCGHQFGYLSLLGDGRALLLAEVVTSKNERFDLHLKGSGKTPFSRGGDGRATLSAMLREYIMSEAMHSLGVSTTRSLAVVTTGEKVVREYEFEGAILTRVASSHIRIGTFEYVNIYGSKEDVKQLANYIINRHYSNLNNKDNKYELFLKEVCNKQAKTIAKWQSIGFIHGVMNTDNILVTGETIDYGPCAFMNIYDPDTVFSSIDRHGRYSYKNQPLIGAWNLARFAETLVTLLDIDESLAIKKANSAIEYYNECYKKEWLYLMTKKLGIANEKESDEALVDELLQIMFENKLDYTNTFRQLIIEPEKYLRIESFKKWFSKWVNRLNQENMSKREVKSLMMLHNCNVIPRNHLVENALEDAIKNDDLGLFNELLKITKRPYDYDRDVTKYISAVEDNSYRTYCNT